MRDYRDQNYYELLEVSKYATQQELSSSYQRVRRYLRAESVATYSLFLPEELNVLSKRIDEAYRILSNPESKRKYDQTISSDSVDPDFIEPGEPPPLTHRPEPLHENTAKIITKEEKLPETTSQAHPPPPLPQAPVRTIPLNLEPQTPFPVDENTQYTGELFRQAREHRGLTLDKISERTKISLHYLNCLENDQFDELPPKVYVKGFLKQLAKMIGLDPEAAAIGYLTRID